MRYLAATELLYVMYIGSVARNRMSKKLERLLSVMLLPINFTLLGLVIIPGRTMVLIRCTDDSWRTKNRCCRPAVLSGNEALKIILR